MTITTETSSLAERYTALRYPGQPYHFTHPDRLAALAKLHGMDPPPIEACRVLELGCGDGQNALSMAWSLPGAQIVAVDACAPGVEDARRCAEALGMANVELLVADIAALPDLGTFDYIVSHGVLSWVPPEVQEALVGAVGRLLRPDGVAMVSYNTYPGWHLRNLARGIMMWHGEPYADPVEKVRAGRTMLGFFAETLANTGDSAYARSIVETEGFFRRCTDQWVFHDVMAPICLPFWFTEFAALAGRHGLAHVCDAVWQGDVPGGLTQAFTEVALQVPDVVRREQLVDLMRNGMFRRSVLCRGEQELRRPAGQAGLDGFWVTMLGEHRGESADGMLFATRDERSVTSHDPLVSEALLELARHKPRGVPVRELFDLVATRVPIEGEGTAAREAFDEALLQLFAAELVDLAVRPRPVVTDPGERPVASALARWQAAAGYETVSNVMHEPVELGPFEQALVLACDGTRDHAALADALLGAAQSGRISFEVDGTTLRDAALVRAAISEMLPERLRRMVLASLLELPARRPPHSSPA